MNKITKLWIERCAWTLAVLVFVVVACEKDVNSGDPPEYDAHATSSASASSVAFDDAAVIADLAYEGEYDGKTANVLSCAQITVDTLASNLHRVTVDFGTGCTDGLGNVRTGIIRAAFTVPRMAAGAMTDIQFIDYTLNQVKIEGLYHQTFLGLNTANQPEWAVDIDGSTVYSPGDTLFYLSDRTRTWVSGFNSSDPGDIRFSISGSASGDRTGELPWIATTLESLTWKYGCRWPVDGVYEVSVTGRPVYQVDFGNGNCDNEATVSGSGGNTIVVRL